MRIFYSFLIVFTVAILFMLPITEGVYDFRTDVKEDEFRYETGGGVTTANLTLLKAVYDDDVSTIDAISDNSDDVPVVEGYHSGTRVVDISGLDTSANRTLTISYDIDALNSSGAISGFVDRLGWIWLICVIAFAPAALAAMWIGRK